jgi:broad specificity phosphatase PhoE
MPHTLYLARHGTPDWTRRDLPYHLPPGPPLTGQGRLEAGALGAFFSRAGVRRVYTSPLQRCLDTARIAAGVCAARLEVVQDLIEWQPGETESDVVKRLWPVVEAALEEPSPPALVTHGGPVAALLTRCGLQAETLLEHRIYDHNNPLPPAGVWRVYRPHTAAAWQLELVFVPDPTLTMD